MARTIRGLAVAAIALLGMAAAPAGAFACGVGPMTFHQVVEMSPLVVVARVDRPQGRNDVFVVEQILKGSRRPVQLVPTDQMPLRVHPGDRVVLALMHPGISDGAGVTVWKIRPNGRLSDAGVSNAPATMTGMIAQFSVPATSTTGELTGSGDPFSPAGGMLAVAVVALLGVGLGWRRFGARVGGSPA